MNLFKKDPKKYVVRNLIIYGFIIVLLLMLISVLFGEVGTPKSMNKNYNQIMDDIQNYPNTIAKIMISDLGVLKVYYKDGTESEAAIPWINSDSGQSLMKLIVSKGIPLITEKPSDSNWLTSLFLSTILPLVILVALWFYFMRAFASKGGANQAMGFTKSGAKIIFPGQGGTTFKDVAGLEEAKEELKEIVDFLKNMSKYITLGAKLPKGVLLVGAPGCGKTLLAKAVAGEANVPFIHISGSDFVELFVGVGAGRVRDLFAQARKNSPAIIFIDEIDAVGRQRGAGLGGGHDEREQTLNQLLVEMDGFETKDGIIVMAATNRPDILDPALLRPGRFDRKVVVDRPDKKGRAAIFKVHMKGKPIDSNVNVEILAKRTPGFVGADIANCVNESILLTARRNKKIVTMDEFEEAIDRVIAGPEMRSKVISPKERKIVAYHESGHAIVGELLPNANPVHKISIIPRGHAALGYTLNLPSEDKYLSSKSELEDEICAILGGRVAEQITFNEITTGAANDLERASKLARKMVCQYGMSEKIGPILWGSEEHEIFLGKDLSRMKDYSEETAREIDLEVKKIIETAYKKTMNILISSKDKLERLAQELLEKEVIYAEELHNILGDNGGNDEANSSEIGESITNES